MNYHKLTINFLCMDISETGDVGELISYTTQVKIYAFLGV